MFNLRTVSGYSNLILLTVFCSVFCMEIFHSLEKKSYFFLNISKTTVPILTPPICVQHALLILIFQMLKQICWVSNDCWQNILNFVEQKKSNKTHILHSSHTKFWLIVIFEGILKECWFEAKLIGKCVSCY